MLIWFFFYTNSLLSFSEGPQIKYAVYITTRMKNKCLCVKEVLFDEFISL